MLKYDIRGNKLLGELAILFAASAWGIISIFTLPLKEKFAFNSYEITFIRILFSAIFLFIYILIKDNKLLRINIKDLTLLAVTGMVFLGLCTTYTLSIEKNGSAVAAMLQYTSPIWTLIASCFIFKEKVTSRKVIGLIGIICGCVLLTFGGEINLSFEGVLIGLLVAFLLASYNILCKIGSMKYKPETVMFYVFIFASIGGFFVSKGWDVPIKIIDNPISLVYFVSLSLISTVIAYILFSFGLAHVSAGKSSILSSFELVVATFVGLIVFKVYPSVLGYIGVCITILSIVFMELKKRDRKNLKTQ